MFVLAAALNGTSDVGKNERVLRDQKIIGVPTTGIEWQLVLIRNNCVCTEQKRVFYPCLFHDIFSSFSGAFAMQSFTSQPVYTEVNPGSPAMLECRVDNIGGECRWQKDGKVRTKLGFS